MASTLERLRIRAPSLKTFMRRAMSDRRNVQYDLLPLLASIQSRKAMADAIRWSLPKTGGLTPSDQASDLHKQLDRRGYTDHLPVAAPEQIADMMAYFKDQPCCDFWRMHLGEFPWDAPVSQDTNLGCYRIEQILLAPHLFRVFNHPDVLAAAELYLGAKPTIDNIQCWWSYPERSVSKGTQRYHRDWDNIRGFKLFLYLTDVGEENGPHCFVAGSHQSDLLMETRALLDEEVHEAFGRPAERRFTGAAGTSFLVDTFGVHKGLLPTSGRRLILSAQYNLTQSPHGPKSPPIAGDGTFDPYINRIYLSK